MLDGDMLIISLWLEALKEAVEERNKLYRLWLYLIGVEE